MSPSVSGRAAGATVSMNAVLRGLDRDATNKPQHASLMALAPLADASRANELISAKARTDLDFSSTFPGDRMNNEGR